MPPFSLRPAQDTDAPWIAELRAEVLRADLERLGRYDPVRVRRRFLDVFVPAHTQVIVVDGIAAGCIGLRPAQDGQWIEHFYLDPSYQGRGLGGSVLAALMEHCADSRAFRLNVLAGSPARRLYLRHGFSVDSEDPVDVYMVAPGSTAPHYA